MERTSGEGSRRRRRGRSTKSEAAEATMVSSESEAKMASEEESGRILNLESEEDRKILMKVKSEEGKIRKLKKEYEEANKAGMRLRSDTEIMVPKAQAVAAGKKKKTKKVVVKRLIKFSPAQIDFAKAMAAHPGPDRSLTEEQLAMEPEDFQYCYRQDIRIRATRLAFFMALVDQHERFGFAVEESETEVTDNEDEDEHEDGGHGGEGFFAIEVCWIAATSE